MIGTGDGHDSVDAAPPRILVVTNNYPSPDLPHVGTFVASLVRAWEAAGTPVAVAAPVPYWSRTTGAVAVRDAGPGPQEGFVLRPPFVSFSNATLAPGWSTARLSLWSFDRAVLRCTKRLPFRPSVAYGHFLFPACHAALRVGRRLGIPVVGALGEADLGEWERLVGVDRAAATARALDAIVSVSHENAEHCARRYGVADERVVVLPNAVDASRFQPLERAAARARLGLPADRPIVAFVGSFIERKGALRVLEAIRGLPDVMGVFLGAGPQRPEGDRVLFAGRVANEEVPVWLSAANLFVLPTRAEGSPNAVLEAMACGLPVVSGDIPALRETTTPDAARLVDPSDVQAIRQAVGEIVSDAALAARMSAAARRIAGARSLADRAERITTVLAAVIARDARERPGRDA